MSVVAATSPHPATDQSAVSGFNTIALVGPPNSGKTTLFNRLTGLRQQVGNYPGVTVEQHRGSARASDGRNVNLIDLPGVYGLSPRAEDERVAVEVLQGKMAGVRRPDAVVLVLDSTQLKRHLTFAAEAIGLGLPTLVVLNMADELRANGGTIDVLALARELGTRVALVSASTGEGLPALGDFFASGGSECAPVELPVLTDSVGRVAWANGVTQRSSYRCPATPIWTKRLDSVLLHRVYGPIILAVVLVAIFQTIFSVGQPLSTALQNLLDASGKSLEAHLPASMWSSMIVDGAWSGTASVLVFLPQILLLFLIVGVLEDSGYLARAAVTADRTMAKVGLNGKCFIPLLSAFGCAVPAIMATRTIESKRDRLATIFVAPFMTCSARLPVYTMLIAAFIPDRRLLGPFLGARAAAMLGLYVLGFVMAVASAKVMNSSVLKHRGVPFLMELPTYRWPSLRSLALRLYDRGKAFVVRAGTVIMVTSILLWVATNLPLENGHAPAIENSVVASVGHAIEPAIRPLGFDWKVGVGLLTCVAARETIIATLGTLHGLDAETQSLDLQAALRHDLTPAAAVALLIFFALAMQCMSTLAVVRRETNSWKWPAAQFAYMTVAAYVLAFIANRAVTWLL